MHSVDAACLSNALHSANSLLEAKRRPWQFKIDDQSTPMVKVEPFARGVGGQKQTSCAAGKCAQILSTFDGRETTMQRYWMSPFEQRRQPGERVAILGKDDGRLARTAEQP